MREPTSIEDKFNNFVESNKSTLRFESYINQNYTEMFNWWIDYFPFKQSELTNVRRMIEFEVYPSVEKISKMLDIFRSETRPKNESFEYYVVLFNDEHANKMLKIKSEKSSGDKNPGYQHGGKYSAWSKNFIHDDSDHESRLHQMKAKSSATKQANPENVNTRPEFFMKRFGMNYDEAMLALSERQSTFSFESCVEKHGDDEGFKIWKNRQSRYLETMNNKSVEEMKDINFRKLPSENDATVSKLEIEIVDAIKSSGLDVEVQKPLSFSFDGTKWKLYDICFGYKIIEVHGRYWHADPRLYNPNDVVIGRLASEIWEKDRLKIESAKSQGYDVVVIWEDDYHANPELVIKSAIEFLTS
jgi:hypothetical protein